MLVPFLPKSYKAFPILNKTDSSWAYLSLTATGLFYFLPRFLHRAASAHCPGRPSFCCIAAHCGHLSDHNEFTSQQATNAMTLQKYSRYFESPSSMAFSLELNISNFSGMKHILTPYFAELKRQTEDLSSSSQNSCAIRHGSVHL